MSILNLKIGIRLALGYVLVIVMLVVVAFLGINGMGRTDAELHHIVDVNVHKIELLEQLANSSHVISRVVRSIALLEDEKEKEIQGKKITEARDVYSRAYAALEKLPLDASSLTMMEKIKLVHESAYVLNQKFRELEKQDKAAAVAFLMTQAVPVNTNLQELIASFVELQNAENKNEVEFAEASFQNARLWMLGLTGLAMLLCGITGWVISKSITGPINEAVQIAETVASGDLTRRIMVKSQDETGKLLNALKTMNDSLIRIVGQVRVGTDTIATASGQIASGNVDLSNRTEEQASSLEKTASAMEQLTSTVKQNADNAMHANQLVISSSEVATQGGVVVARVVAVMGEINSSSKKIVDIISVIDGIAFQTNILALNAAVEAARAGEQGRGFAVVASEVRNLAQRSAAAAREIKVLIGDSVGKVDEGAHLVDQAGSTMQAIVSSITSVTDIMSEITAASREQTVGIEQINQSITLMDEVTQQNAALVEQAAAAAGSLQDQARTLASVVGVFKVPMGLGSESQFTGHDSPHKQKRPAVEAVIPRAKAPGIRSDKVHKAVRPIRLQASGNKSAQAGHRGGADRGDTGRGGADQGSADQGSAAQRPTRAVTTASGDWEEF